MIDEIAGMLGLKKAGLIGGFLGALVSLRFFPDLKTWWQRCTTLFSGWVCAAYVGPLVASTLDIAEKHEGGVTFLVGVVGMALIANVLQAIPDWLRAARSRFGSG